MSRPPDLLGLGDGRAVEEFSSAPRRWASSWQGRQRLPRWGIGGWTTPWGKNPDGAIGFTLPSGVECEYRIGNLDSTSPERTDELRAWLDDHTLDQVADIDATIRDMRAEEQTYVRDDGTEVEVGYGTPYYDANNEYFDAVNRAVNAAIADRAEETGILKEDGSLGLAGELLCADGWEPTSTWLP